jgi:hypothetical protein
MSFLESAVTSYLRLLRTRTDAAVYFCLTKMASNKSNPRNVAASPLRATAYVTSVVAA